MAWAHSFHAQYKHLNFHLTTPFMYPVTLDICVPCIEVFVHAALMEMNGHPSFVVQVIGPEFPQSAVTAMRVDHVLAMDVLFSGGKYARVEAVALCLTTTGQFAFMVGSSHVVDYIMHNQDVDERNLYDVPMGVYVVLGSSIAEVVTVMEAKIGPGNAVWYLDHCGRLRLTLTEWNPSYILNPSKASNIGQYKLRKVLDELDHGLHRLNEERRYARNGIAYTFGEFKEWYMYQQLLDTIACTCVFEDFMEWRNDPDHADRWEVHKFARFIEWLVHCGIIPRLWDAPTLWRFRITYMAQLGHPDFPYSFGEYIDWYSERAMEFWEEAPPAERLKLRRLLAFDEHGVVSDSPVKTHKQCSTNICICTCK